MKKMILTAVATFALVSFAHAEDSAMQNAKDEVKQGARKASRMAKKGAHRVEEAACMEGDVKCAGKKMKNRAVEAKDAAVDAGKNVKDEVSH